MINKISNLKLVLGLVLLGLVYLAVVYFEDSKSVELEKQLVSIDTAQISRITIHSPDETVTLYKEGVDWQIALTTGKRVPALTNKVNTLLGHLMDISTDRLAAKDEGKWVDYNVDSTGTQVQVQQGEITGLDMIVGQVGTTSYLRLAGETEVYASDEFKGLQNQDEINNYRDNTFIRMETDSIQSIAFDYPGDSSFLVVNDGGVWNFEDGTAADSAKTVNYLRGFSLKHNDNFSDQDGSTLGPRLAEIFIISKNQSQIKITAYKAPVDSVIYHSSLNEEAYFNDQTLGEDFFIGKPALSLDVL